MVRRTLASHHVIKLADWKMEKEATIHEQLFQVILLKQTHLGRRLTLLIALPDLSPDHEAKR
jgi:hypothetical protein